MRIHALDCFRCPYDFGNLALASGAPEEDGHVMDGALECQFCKARYPIIKGVPNFVTAAHLVPTEGHAERAGLRDRTVDRFGWQWSTYRDWGWLESYPSAPDAKERFHGALLAHTRAAFYGKTLITEDELSPAQTILDAGCGNGRFVNIAAATGATVFGVDLGPGADVAFEHLRQHNNVHIARADLFNLPFADATFDFAFSVGVLMHTGDARKAFLSMARTVAPGGRAVAHVYGQGLPSYEIIDKMARMVTTRLPLRIQRRFACAMAAAARFLKRTPRGTWLYWHIFRHLQILPTETHMFDWWAAPVATHHTIEELAEWFEAASLTVLRSNPPGHDDAARAAMRRAHASLTMLGART